MDYSNKPVNSMAPMMNMPMSMAAPNMVSPAMTAPVNVHAPMENIAPAFVPPMAMPYHHHHHAHCCKPVDNSAGIILVLFILSLSGSCFSLYCAIELKLAPFRTITCQGG